MDRLKCYINGIEVEVGRETTILNAARQSGIYIPALCFHSNLPYKEVLPQEAIYQGGKRIQNSNSQKKRTPCGLCLVKIQGEQDCVRACETKVSEGMRIITEDEELRQIRRERLKQILESSNHPSICITCDRRPRCEPFGVCVRSANVTKRCVACPQYPRCELMTIADSIGMIGVTLPYNDQGSGEIVDNLLFEFDPALCIGCLRCVRMCGDVRGVGALGFVIHEDRVYVGTKAEDFGKSGCKYCMGCVEVCPTGALVDKKEKWKPDLDQEVRAKQLVPCKNTCPAGIDIPLYIYLTSQKRFKDAFEVIKQELPFPLLCGFACSRPCEEACRRKDLDAAVAIRDLKRFIAEQCKEDYEEAITAKSSGKKVAIVGSGPSGLTAAYMLAKFGGHFVTIFEALSEPGGMPLAVIPRFRLPKEVIDMEVKRVTALGVTIKTGTKVESVNRLLSDGFDAVLLALGCQEELSLGIKGEDENELVTGALGFLRNVNMGNAPQMSGKAVVIVGGGNAAIDSARTCLRLGATEVKIIYRRSKEQMTADPSEVKAAEEEGVQFLFQTIPSVINHNNDMVELHCLKTQLRGKDRSGRPRPFPVRGSEFKVETNMVIVAVGQKPGVPEDMAESVSRKGILKVQEHNLMTSVEGVFASGDVVTGPSSIISAIAMGKKAARAIDLYLGGDGLLWQKTKVGFKIPECLPKAEEFFMPRFQVPMLAIEERTRGFEVVEKGYTEEMAVMESQRCLRCSLRAEINNFPFI